MYISADPLITTAVLFGAYDPTAESLLQRQIPYAAPYYTSGRVALWAVLGSMGVGPGDSVLLPAFICDSVLGPIEARGASSHFFPVTNDIGIRIEDVKACLTPATRAIVIPHYYGFATPLDELLALCEERGIWLIEDCAHALYSFVGDRPLGRQGHAAVFSPWKSLPLADGGILVLNDARLVRPDPLPEPSAFRLAVRMAYRVLPTIETVIGWSPRLELLRRGGVRESIQERDRSPGFLRESGSDFSQQVLERANGFQIREKRRANYHRLAKALASTPYLRALVPRLHEGICPLGLPVRSADREQAREHFLNRGINVRAYWERLPREVSAEEFPEAHQISREILILPVHQSLTQRQIEHIERAIETLPGGTPT